jgi:hypothetical protein
LLVDLQALAASIVSGLSAYLDSPFHIVDRIILSSLLSNLLLDLTGYKLLSFTVVHCSASLCFKLLKEKSLKPLFAHPIKAALYALYKSCPVRIVSKAALCAPL